MAFDELSVVLKAREFVNRVNPASFPVDVDSFLKEANAVVQLQDDLSDDEPGWSFVSNGKHYICVNENDKPERRRFTIFHELAHIILGLPSDHGAPAWSYAKKSMNEILCDVFAAELLFPYKLYKPLVDRSDFSFAAIEGLAHRFEGSLSAAGSRYAAVAAGVCAFVFAEKGIVRYASRSSAMRGAKIWIPPKMKLPTRSVGARMRAGETSSDPEEIDPELWISDWNRDGVLLEEARHFSKRDQTFSLLWFEEDEILEPRQQDRRAREQEEFGLAELDGILPWPGKSRRR
jgi:hypothetical protein